MTLGALWGHSGPILESPWTEIRNMFFFVILFSILFASSRLGGNREVKSITPLSVVRRAGHFGCLGHESCARVLCASLVLEKQTFLQNTVIDFAS